MLEGWEQRHSACGAVIQSVVLCFGSCCSLSFSLLRGASVHGPVFQSVLQLVLYLWCVVSVRGPVFLFVLQLVLYLRCVASVRGPVFLFVLQLVLQHVNSFSL